MILSHFIIIIAILCLLPIPFSVRPQTVSGAAAKHAVISEIQLYGTSANDEYIELYNPTATPIEMNNWRLTRFNSQQTPAYVVSSLSGTIPAYGNFLIASPEYLGTIQTDIVYSNSGTTLAAGSAIVLYSDAGITLVDKVGMGTSTYAEYVGVDNPPNGGSVERKAVINSTFLSMSTGGIHEFWGNGEDTNHNGNDFVVQTSGNPQNSHSATELIPLPTPTPTTTPTSTPSPTSTPTPTPTFIPTFTPSPTPTPTITPTIIPTYTPTIFPTPSPTLIPTLTPTPTLPLKGWLKPAFYKQVCGKQIFKAALFSRAFTFYQIACKR